MNCPKCNRPNRDRATYCKWCGEPVVTAENASLQALVGMTDVKNRLQELTNHCNNIKQRAKIYGTPVDFGNMNMVVSGNTGVGKDELVKVIQRQLYLAGVVKKDRACIVSQVNWKKESDREINRTTGTSPWNDLVKKAQDGLLVVTDAHLLVPRETAKTEHELSYLFDCMDREWNNNPVVVLLGMPELKTFIQNNPDSKNLFKYHFDLPDFTYDELSEICRRKLQTFGLSLSPDAGRKLENVFKTVFREKNDPKTEFANAHTALRKADEIYAAVLKRDIQATVVECDDIGGKEFRQKTCAEIMAELDNDFVGIDNFKQEISLIGKRLDDEAAGGGARQITWHYIFTGNPGTGKTTIARKFGEILNALDALPTGQFIEVSAKDLIAGYVGQTAQKVDKAVNDAMGGVLFIDEAYSLLGSSFSDDAINALLKPLEDKKGKFVCIAAGYPHEMEEFVKANPGIARRFGRRIDFKDYEPKDLAEIFRRRVKKAKLTLDSEAERHLENFFRQIYLARDPKTFGNAGVVANLFDQAKERKSLRRDQPDYNPAVLARADIEGEDALTDKDLDTIFADMDSEFIGMTDVKQGMRALAEFLEVERERQEAGASAELTKVHIMLTGNPGTGKTTVARKFGEIFKAIGLLPAYQPSKFIETQGEKLKSSYVNDTGKQVNDAVDRAMGGILFIDEAYGMVKRNSLGKIDDPTGLEAVNALMTRLENDAGKFVCIIAGYKQPIEDFVRDANPGLESRFPPMFRLHIADYTADELASIFMKKVQNDKSSIGGEAVARLEKLIALMVDERRENFGNAREMNNLFATVKSRRATRLTQLKKEGVALTREMYNTFEADDIPYEEPAPLAIDDIFGELDRLVGLKTVKTAIRDIVDNIEIERERAKMFGTEFKIDLDNYRFVGNPGTGKTTVARLMGQIFHALGLLPTDKLVETGRDKLVGAYQGHTEEHTKSAIESARGGILFIDEAYRLSGDTYGQIATDTLVQAITDQRYQGKMIFIAAGYPREIQQWINSNSGLESRFRKVIYFDDYNGDEMSQIFLKIAEKQQRTLTPEAETAVREYFDRLSAAHDKNFANARTVNNFFVDVKRRQDVRLKSRIKQPDFKRDELKIIVKEDIVE